MTTTNKILDTLVGKKVLDKIAKDLGLVCKPHIVYSDDTAGNIMAAVYDVHYKGIGIVKYICATETRGEIRVNVRALDSIQKRYALMCGSRQAAVDITICLLRHECKHLWQYENGSYLYEEYEDAFKASIRSMIDGHGTDPHEMEANEYAITSAKTKRVRSLARFMEVEQRMPQQVTPEYIQEVRSAMVDMTKEYNAVFNKAWKVLFALI